MRFRHIALLAVGLFVLALVAGCSSSSGPDEAADDTAPTIAFANMVNNGVVRDEATIEIDATDSRSMDQVDFYVDGVLVLSDTEAPYQYTWDGTGQQMASTHVVYAVAWDAADNSAQSAPCTLHYQWRRIASDPDETMEQDIQAVYVRSSDTMLEFRVETYGSWVDPYEWGYGVDVGIFMDTDLDYETGLNYDEGWFYWPNDIGADYAAVVGWEDDSLWSWDEDYLMWNTEAPHAYVDLNTNSDYFEFGVSLAEMGNPTEMDIVVLAICPGSYFDYAPDAYHIHYVVDHCYQGQTRNRPAARTHRSAVRMGAPKPLFTGVFE